jgi:hypothetical protein
MTIVAPESTAEPASTPSPAKQPIGLCLDCNYPLRGLPTPRCPECGKEFDPLDPATMNMGRELSALAQWLLGPIRRSVNLLTWAALAFALWSARLPGGQIGNSRSIYILIAIGTFWMLWPIVRWMAARHYGWPHSLLMQGQQLRVAVGLCILLGAVAIVYGLPLRATLLISHPAMDRLAADTMQSKTPYLEDCWVGLFAATRVKQVPGGMRFTVEEHDRAYRAGFTYLPKVDPKRVGWSTKNYRYLGGGWWAWREEG